MICRTSFQFDREKLTHLMKEEQDQLHKLLEIYREKLLEIGAHGKVRAVATKHVGHALVRVQEEEDAQFIVMGGRGKGTLRRTFIGAASVIMWSPRHSARARLSGTVPYLKSLKYPDDVVLLVTCKELSKVVSSFWNKNLFALNKLSSPTTRRFCRRSARAEEETKKAMLKPYGDKLQEVGIKFKPLILVSQNPGYSIVNTAQAENAGLIVMGSRGHGKLRRTLYQFAAGFRQRQSVTSNMAAKGAQGGRVVVIAIDGSDAAAHAFETYMQSLKYPEDTVVLVACDELNMAIANFWKGGVFDYNPDVLQEKLQKDEQEKKALLKSFQDKLQEAGIKFKAVVLVSQNPGATIVATADSEKADLIVMGSRGHGLVTRTLIGSCSNYVLNHTSVPVVICRNSS
nr:hypothetical protein BaRGS_017288 [Batillaria attramentaria]